MHFITFVIFICDVILLITWQVVFNPRAVRVLREVSLNDVVLIKNSEGKIILTVTHNYLTCFENYIFTCHLGYALK